MVCEIRQFPIATQWIFVGSQIWKREVNERPTLHNLRIDHVTIRSELRYWIGAQVVRLKCRLFGGKTGHIATVRVCGVARPIATFRFQVELDPQMNRDFGPVAYTSLAVWASKVNMAHIVSPEHHYSEKQLRECDAVGIWDTYPVASQTCQHSFLIPTFCHSHQLWHINLTCNSDINSSYVTDTNLCSVLLPLWLQLFCYA